MAQGGAHSKQDSGDVPGIPHTSAPTIRFLSTYGALSNEFSSIRTNLCDPVSTETWCFLRQAAVNAGIDCFDVQQLPLSTEVVETDCEVHVRGRHKADFPRVHLQSAALL